MSAGNPENQQAVVINPPAAQPAAGRAPTNPDLRSQERVSDFFSELTCQVANGNELARVLIPWFCDRLGSPKSRRDYATVLRAFLLHLSVEGIAPQAVTGDTVRLYKEAMAQAGYRPATIAQHLSVIRGTYRELGKKGIVNWETVGDIQAVVSPRVDKNSTPHLSEEEAKRLLHAPDKTTTIGLRDHALLFTYFKTACRCSAIANAKVGDLEWTDLDLYLVVTEKGKKERRLALLEAGTAVLEWLEVAGIRADKDAPLFPALERDYRTVTRRCLSPRQVLSIVKKYAARAGLEANRQGRRGIGVHSLRKTAGMSALKHGAKVEQVQAWMGHADIRTTQEYIVYKDEDAEEAARHCRIR